MGLVVAVTDVGKAQVEFALVRSRAKDPQLDCLSFRRDPTGHNGLLWVVKTGIVPKDEIKRSESMRTIIDEIVEDSLGKTS